MAIVENKNITPVFGTSGDDHLTGNQRSEVFSGRGGDDVIQARSGSDEVYGGSGDDHLYGENGDDILYGGGGPSYADMGAFVISEDYMGTVTFLNEGAGYRNALGLYKVDEDGAISDVQIVFPNASKQGSGGNLIPGVSSVDVALEAGDQLGFFIVSNGYGKGSANQQALSALDGSFELRMTDGSAGSIHSVGGLELWHLDESGQAYHVRSQYGYETYHSAAVPQNDYALNADNFPHTVGRVNSVTGDVILGFEDLKNGGDKDYDDSVFSLDVGVSNARVLDPNISYADDGQDQGDLADGDGGDDGLVALSENDVLYGGQGADILFGMAANDILHGGDGMDLLYGNSGLDYLYGNAGQDDLRGGSGNDFLFGEGGDDVLNGQSGDDQLQGGLGADVLEGSSGDDILYGNEGNDELMGGSGADSLYAGIGNDILKGGSGDDLMYGGDGTDQMEGGKGDDMLSGGSGADRLKGGSGDDVLAGDDGRDYLNGGKGSDILSGGAGNDRLLGEKGDDVLTGGEGEDVFSFRMADCEGNQDVITDFQAGLDIIKLYGFGFDNVEDVLDALVLREDGVYLGFDDDDGLLCQQASLDDFDADSFLLF